jgi:hypothetical protein
MMLRQVVSRVCEPLRGPLLLLLLEDCPCRLVVGECMLQYNPIGGSSS